MNPMRKIWCRTFQTVFRMALPFLPYREPKRVRGMEALLPVLEARGLKTVLLVTDRQLRRTGLTAPLEEMLDKAGIRCAVYDGTRPNPTTENVEEARAVYLENGCQCLIAFGGGSSMDCAKAVGARIAYPNRSLRQMKGTLRVLRKIPPLIAIPTTAGTGSETTLAAVITDPENRHKYPMNDFVLIPSYAVLDPAVTFTLPPFLTATTGMDALTHAVEAYIGRSTTRETRDLACRAVRLIFGNLERAYTNGRDREARANMLEAAYLAGEAFSKSYVGYIHAVAHSLGGQYNVAHGLANSVLLPVFLEAYGKKIHSKLKMLAIEAGVAGETDSPQAGAEKFIHAIREMNQRMGIPDRIPEIREADIPQMARHADKEANPLYPVPVLMDEKALERFYYIAMEGGSGYDRSGN